MKVLLHTLPVGAFFRFTDDGFGNDPKSDEYRVVEYYGQVVGSAPMLSGPKQTPVRHGKKDWRPNSGVVFIDDQGKMPRTSLMNDVFVFEISEEDFAQLAAQGGDK